MTEKQIRDLFTKWQRRLGLTNWDLAIEFSEKVTLDGNLLYMRARRSVFYRRAVIEVGHYVLDPGRLPSESIEKALEDSGVVTHEESVEVGIVHELLHCAMRDVMEASDLIRDHLNPPVTTVWDGAWRRAEEDFVESLAIALVRNWGQ